MYALQLEKEQKYCKDRSSRTNTEKHLLINANLKSAIYSSTNEEKVIPVVPKYIRNT